MTPERLELAKTVHGLRAVILPEWFKAFKRVRAISTVDHEGIAATDVDRDALCEAEAIEAHLSDASDHVYQALLLLMQGHDESPAELIARLDKGADL